MHHSSKFQGPSSGETPQTCKDGILRKVMPIAKKHYLEINEYSLVFFNKLKKEVSPIAITHTMYQDHYAI